MPRLSHPSHYFQHSGWLPWYGRSNCIRPFLLPHAVSWTRFPPSSFGSTLHPLIFRVTMASADSCRPFTPPFNGDSPRGHDVRSPRVMRTCFHAYACRIYGRVFRADFGLRRYRTPYPARSPRMRLLFVRPAFCHGLPSHGRLTAPQLPFGWTFPLQGGQQTYFVVSDVHCQAGAPCRAHRQKGPLGKERAS
jgi:hypothetical protein